MKTRIIVDSTADLLPHLQEQVHVIPMTLRFGDQEYIDGVTIDRQTFYQKLIDSKEYPTTSQASPAKFIEEYEKAKEAGESAVVITLASKFSGTYQSACIAAVDYDDVYVVESGTVAVGGGILVERAIQLRDQGLSAKEIVDRLNEEKDKIVVIALVDTLEYLKRGGRVSKSVAFAGTMLNIKPMIEIIHGEVLMAGKARGIKQGNALLMQEIEKVGGVDFNKPVLLGYTGLTDAHLLKFIDESRVVLADHLSEVHYTCISSVLGTHAGPGAVAVAFFKK